MSFFNIFKGSPRELFFTTDIHSHLCPGIDDGAPDVEHAANLAQDMRDMGFTRMIITPHVIEDEFPNTRATIDASFDDLRAETDRRNIDLEFAVSAEYRVDSSFRKELGNGTLRIFPDGKHILVESDWSMESYGLIETISELARDYNMVPILAHPERYHYYFNDPSAYGRIMDAGGKLQINILSLAGYYGPPSKAIAEDLLAAGMVSFVGTDMHHSRHSEGIRRYLQSRDYRKLLDHKNEIENDKIDFRAVAK